MKYFGLGNLTNYISNLLKNTKNTEEYIDEEEISEENNLIEDCDLIEENYDLIENIETIDQNEEKIDYNKYVKQIKNTIITTSALTLFTTLVATRVASNIIISTLRETLFGISNTCNAYIYQNILYILIQSILL
jgi:hypothetical protein